MHVYERKNNSQLKFVERTLRSTMTDERMDNLIVNVWRRN